MVRYEFKSIGIWALIKVSFFLNLIFGFTFGVFYALILIPLTRWVTQLTEVESLHYENDTSMGMLFLLPFLFALFAALFNTLFAVVIGVLYNGIARITGGLEFNIEKMPEVPFLKVQPVAPQPMDNSISGLPHPIQPAPPPPYRPQSFRPEPLAQPESLQHQGEAAQPNFGPVPDNSAIEPHVEPDEDGPRQDNP